MGEIFNEWTELEKPFTTDHNGLLQILNEYEPELNFFDENGNECTDENGKKIDLYKFCSRYPSGTYQMVLVDEDVRTYHIRPETDKPTTELSNDTDKVVEKTSGKVVDLTPIDSSEVNPIV
jgi:hypothetical protein